MPLLLGLIRTLIRSSDKDPWLTVPIHPDGPCPPIAELQSQATKMDIFYNLPIEGETLETSEATNESSGQPMK